MNSSATFINAVMDVRIEQGVFHLSLGEMLPGKNGKPEFISAFRAVIPADSAADLFAFLYSKAQDPSVFHEPSSERSDHKNAEEANRDSEVKRKVIISSQK